MLGGDQDAGGSFMQGTFLRVWAARGRYEAGQGTGPRMFTLAYNLCRNEVPPARRDIRQGGMGRKAAKPVTKTLEVADGHGTSTVQANYAFAFRPAGLVRPPL